MRRSSSKFLPRISEVDGFCIFVGPCDKCPTSVEPWIKQFCSQPGNEWYVKVDRDWADDYFNQYGLDDLIPNFDIALEMITDIHSDDWMTLSDQNIKSILLQAKHLYGLLHARYITQSPGIKIMKSKYLEGQFGVCPRYMCEEEKLLPVGRSDKIKKHNVNLYCPRCCEIYKAPKDIKIDGAHFGTSFPHIFIESYLEYDPFSKFRKSNFEMFGFKVHRSMLPKHMPHSSNRHEKDVVGN